MKVTIATITSLNYFAKTKSLIESLRRYHQELSIHVLLADYDLKESIINNDYKGKNIYYCNPEVLKINELKEMAFKYNILEFNASLKPFFIDYLLRDYEGVIYLDPDMVVYNKLTEVLAYMKQYSIIITPHVLSDCENADLLSYLEHGIYNLGFIAIRKDKNALKMLEWWKNKLIDFCICESQDKLFADQKWIDFVPALFEGVYILREAGYNVAFWNLWERTIKYIDDKYYVNNERLVIYHFSNYNLKFPDYLVYYGDKNYRCFPNSKELKGLYKRYYEKVLLMGYDYYSKIEYGFKYFDNGKVILDKYRKIYYNHSNKKGFGNPFETGHSGSFYKYLIQNELE